MHRLTRRALGPLALGGLAACATTDPATEAAVDLGRFQLVAPIIVTKNARKIPPSRDASLDVWETVLSEELVNRFGRYTGGTDYYIALNLDGYALAPPGIPIVLAPKSILVVTANLWTATPQEKVAGPEQLTTFENADSFLLGSGLMMDADEQMRVLARNMARTVQGWMLRYPEALGLTA